jgi:NADH dehydrogenase
VMEVKPGYVVVGGKRLDAVVTLWAAGVQASPLGKMLGTPTDKRGCAVVDLYLNPPNHPDIFVCGDLAHVEENGRQVPGVAQPAMQMGKHAAQLIAQDMAGKPRTTFHYFDKGDMATIGRHAAVANVRWPIKAHWSGTLAWLSWVSVHLFFLVGFRNRLSVFFSWAWTYLTFNRGARLITGSPLLPGWGQQAGIRPQVMRPPMDTTSPLLGVVPTPAPQKAEEEKAAVK